MKTTDHIDELANMWQQTKDPKYKEALLEFYTKNVEIFHIF